MIDAKFKVLWTSPHGHGTIVGEFDSHEEAREVGDDWLDTMNADGDDYRIQVVPA